jgi:tetratricopeptide (TPR) repeat protein
MFVMFRRLRAGRWNIAKIMARTGNVPAWLVFKSTGFGVGLPIGNRERCMAKFAIRLLTLAVFAMALVTAPVITKVYAAPDNEPPPSSEKGKKKKSEVKPGIEDTAFAKGYRAAYASIYDRSDYASAILQLKSLGRDDNAGVANLIGYSYRKLGDYKVSQIWYERALKADPNHVKTWQYYGLWQVEQGNRDSAQYHLNRIAALTGTASEEYRSLAAALEKPPGTGLAY